MQRQRSPQREPTGALHARVRQADVLQGVCAPDGHRQRRRARVVHRPASALKSHHTSFEGMQYVRDA